MFTRHKDVVPLQLSLAQMKTFRYGSSMMETTYIENAQDLTQLRLPHSEAITQNSGRIIIEKTKLYNEKNGEITNIMVRKQYNCAQAIHASYFRL